MVTLLGGHPSLKIGPLLETHKHDIDAILRESLEHESLSLTAYCDLLKVVEKSKESSGVVSDSKFVLLEEYARELIVQEELHQDEVKKMLRRSEEV
jgi:bacterioferritin